ncbi:MAG: D-alanyl-D-alanine carboxypeptidase family protein [Bacillota bacterium]
MRKIVTWLLLSLITLQLFPGAAIAAPSTPVTVSEVAVLIDPRSGDVMFAKNEDLKWDPASLTKIMTLFLTFEAIGKGNLSLSDSVTASEAAWRMGGSQMYLEVGEEVTVEELIKGTAIVSGNDSSLALAERIGGSVTEFASRMNEKAQELGMTGSHFMNPHGLSEPEHYTTGGDMALLATRYINAFPQALEYHSTLEYTHNGIRQDNWNSLLRNPEVDGLKTGHVKDTYNLIATAKRDDYRLIAVVLGAKTVAQREEDAMALLNYGFNNFKAQKIGSKGDVLGQVRVYKGKKKRISAVLPADLWQTVPKDAKESTEVDLPKYLEAPLDAGQEIGQLVVKVGEEVRRYPLVAEVAVRKANFIKVFFHSIWLAIRNIF